MTTDGDFWIPRNLDAPPLFFIWEFDVAAVYIVSAIIGFIFGIVWLGIALALVFGRGYSRIKEDGGSSFIRRILYWYTPSELWLSNNLPSCAREYVGG